VTVRRTTGERRTLEAINGTKFLRVLASGG